KCGCCGKICARLDILEDHRVATGHCFCPDCDIPFESQSALTVHRKTEVHASEFRCCNCDISFKDIHALNAHMASRAHRKPLQEKPIKKESKAQQTIAPCSHERTCEECKRTFKTSQALQHHLDSVKHKPLSALNCPVGKGCRENFTTPSALLHHLESGTCQSGMDRDDIYHMVQLCDKDRRIHNLPTLTPATSSTASPSCPSPRSGVSLDNSIEWSVLSLEGSASDDRVVRPNLRCPLCPTNRKSFATPQALQQHMDSPAHSDKVYHCPSDMRLVGPSKAAKMGKRERQFTSLSGLAQHLESGACYGGKQTFLYCIDLIQRQLGHLGL
ncbi:hypothetical protein BKA66DRAFT_381895, partial [Pyrenochaeta sp. MPI-SDFR-AT-0127]